MSSGRREIAVAVLVFDGVRLLDLTGPLEVFDVAAALGTGHRVTVCSPGGADITTSGGLRIGVQADAAALSAVDTLVVPGGERLVHERPDAALQAAIAQLAAGARRVASVCSGAFALAEAGLLDGKRAATHWRHIGTLRRRFPTVTVDEESIYVRDGRVLTSAGVSAGIDLALALVEEDAGDVVAHEIAKDLVVFMRRRGAQPQLSVPARTPRPRRDPLRLLCDEIAADPGTNHSLASMAARAGLSERHLSRLFKAQTGMTPTAYVLSVRREAALALVEAGETLGAAARRSGIGSEETLRRILRTGRD
ncbi:GlxA family transcriptional regulator [Kribbella voronezhensis]|uniref:GlxA family transcriptional regulator n=1 Tax=Kribbella voronezhensis TaxID=2512212 RepID=UPI00192E207A|nr:AraC family transcriptional regulator [Kribbella voronezhensis]